MEALEFSMVRFDRSGIIAAYLREVRSHKMLNDEQVRNYLRQGNTTAVVNGTLRLVLAVALRYMWAMPLMDLFQEGNIGLLTAARKFNLYGETAFTTFAVLEIRKAILKAIEEDSRLVRRPHHAQGEWTSNESLDEPLSDGEGNTTTRSDSLQVTSTLTSSLTMWNSSSQVRWLGSPKRKSRLSAGTTASALTFLWATLQSV